MNSNKLHAKIKDSRLRRGDIAALAEISPQTLDNLLAGKDTKVSTVEAVCRVVGISPASLFDDGPGGCTITANGAQATAAKDIGEVKYEGSAQLVAAMQATIDAQKKTIETLEQRLRELE